MVVIIVGHGLNISNIVKSSNVPSVRQYSTGGSFVASVQFSIASESSA
jgi:hypothetical protein